MKRLLTWTAAVCAALLCAQPGNGAVNGEILVWDELEFNFNDLSEVISTTDLVAGFGVSTNGSPINQAVNESAIAPYTSGVVDLINEVYSFLMNSGGAELGCLEVVDLLPSDGFYPGLPPTCPGGGVAHLHDGVPGTACQSVLRDYGRASLVVRYGFAAPTDIGRLRVFAGNFNDRDGRVFQNYDVYARQGDCADGICPAHGSFETTLVGFEEFYLVARSVKAGTFGLANVGLWQGSLTQVLNFDSDVLIEDCTDLRFVFYDVTNPGGLFLDPWQGYQQESAVYRDACSNGINSMQEPLDEDGRRKAFVASVIKEIDVLAPLPTPTADIDYDGDIDLRDLAHAQRCFDADVSTNGCYRYDTDANGDFDTVDWVAIAPLVTGPQ